MNPQHKLRPKRRIYVELPQLENQTTSSNLSRYNSLFDAFQEPGKRRLYKAANDSFEPNSSNAAIFQGRLRACCISQLKIEFLRTENLQPAMLFGLRCDAAEGTVLAHPPQPLCNRFHYS